MLSSNNQLSIHLAFSLEPCFSAVEHFIPSRPSNLALEDQIIFFLVPWISFSQDRKPNAMPKGSSFFQGPSFQIKLILLVDGSSSAIDDCLHEELVNILS